MGSTRRVPVGGGRKNWLTEAAATELGDAAEKKDGVKMNIEYKDQLNQLLKDQDSHVEDYQDDKPISALAAELEHKLRQHNSTTHNTTLAEAGGLATATEAESAATVDHGNTERTSSITAAETPSNALLPMI